ncbi:hypothetical protein PIB30_087055 [Stylosanthes scabra]|uniref:Uncharacterized protein n=1 Tax=Stylosanthes scabra TaxID=79078 RepID=A0ABU6STW1_9FABA|nr:hypothetical protein [Stylosanthes scabra]
MRSRSRAGVRDEEVFDDNFMLKRRISGPKCRGRAQGKLKRTREARRMEKKSKRAQLSVDRAPALSRWRARALLSLIWKFPLVACSRDPDGAPAPPLFRNAQDKDLARPRDEGVAPARRRQNSL